jgi:hypothetical protein
VNAPELSYILATDSLDTVRGVLEHLARQTRVDAIEVVLVSPAEIESELARLPPALRQSLRRIRVERTATPLDLDVARAIGVHAAAAPVVFVGETHSYPEPDMVERLLEAFSGPWSAVVPTLVNANPRSPASWAGFLLDYGVWNAGRPAGEIAEPLVYNAAFLRAPLVALGDRLRKMLSPRDHDLWWALAPLGHRAAYEPRARIRHLNVVQRGAFFRERVLCGVRLGLHRARQWPLGRRLLYAAASPLVPFVLAARARAGLRHYAAAGALPRWTALWVSWALVARAAGEACGYLGWDNPASEAETTELEVHKTRYAGEGA